ncbi:hypothetical protein ACROYT_G033488 [Oculina patagonica]
MKGALFLGFTFFCCLWTIGSFLECLECVSSTSYEDCQKNSELINCSRANPACYQAEITLENGSAKKLLFQKGCLGKDDCENYEKGNIDFCNTEKGKGYTGDCKAKCCHEDGCNKGDIVESKGSAFIISVVVLLSGLLLTFVNIN